MRMAEETGVLGDNLPQYHFDHNKSHMTWPDLIWAGTRNAAVGSRWLTAWAVARPRWQVTLQGWKNTAWEKLVHLSVLQNFAWKFHSYSSSQRSWHPLMELEGVSQWSQDSSTWPCPGLAESGRSWAPWQWLSSPHLVFVRHTQHCVLLYARVSK
jgi:hypothetical protein